MRPLRLAATVATLVLLAACGGDPTRPETATLVFRADASCPTGAVELTVDDVVKGQFAMNPGSTIKSFTVSAGNHTAEARLVSGTGGWDEVHFIVDANQTYTLNLVC